MPIEPDLKDWTWVLEQRCPECGFLAADVDPVTLPSMIRANARRWPEVLARPDVRERPRDDRWSPLEYACHVRDVFRLYDQRLGLMLTEDDPLFANWDQDAAAVDDGYNDQDPETVGAELMAAGEELAATFESVGATQWDRPGRRSDGAAFTIDTFGRYFIHDPVHHLMDVGER